jgi:hypothetical protein
MAYCGVEMISRHYPERFSFAPRASPLQSDVGAGPAKPADTRIALRDFYGPLCQCRKVDYYSYSMVRGCDRLVAWTSAAMNGGCFSTAVNNDCAIEFSWYIRDCYARLRVGAAACGRSGGSHCSVFSGRTDAELAEYAIVVKTREISKTGVGAMIRTSILATSLLS